MKTMDEQYETVLECHDISKSFFDNLVLDGVNLACRKGSVLGLVGENGAGKTTLSNIISANIRPDSGVIEFMGRPAKFVSPHDARDNGIVVVHQLLSLIPELSVGENIMLGYESKGRFAKIDNKKLHEKAKKILENIGFHIDVYKTVSEISPAKKQMVEIAKAMARSPKLLILDEPTSSLSAIEVEQLFTLLDRLKTQGVSMILISHRLDEIMTACDEVVVLKDGKLVLSKPIGDVTKGDLINSMVGREVSHAFPKRCSVASGEAMLQLKHINLDGRLKDINLKLNAGFILGVAGLEGQGQRHLARGLFGIERFTSGVVEFQGKRVDISSPKNAMSMGIGFISDDRDTEGLVKVLSVGENIVLTTLKEISRNGFINKKACNVSVDEGVRQLSIKAADKHGEVGFLSGGNQQKVIFSKWIRTKPKLLILHEPTRGIDVQTKIEIYHLLRNLAETGVSIIFFSSDMLELIGLSDEIMVMYEGEIIGRIRGEDATEETIMKLSSGIALDEAIN